ncbi:putative CoA-binding protein [Saccharomonospora marina XMU15]|uniref:Putative CoA-binding protein n=1 Tax=Saccharomonospora marina XMU15 TaxID=882083 RepID=H5X7X6_9PSEU|nr:CoA-binding protein [Saccharomonospora marina]EHR52476.1 putative CoA-binding protein [Saccharomonospora marina XMU15]
MESMDAETNAEAARILREFSTIAVVGCSRDPAKAAHSVPAAMRAAGFRIIPVNPVADTLLGERVYRHLSDIDEPVEVVEVFRPGPEAPAVAEEAVRIGAKALWLQQGITSGRAREIAREAGLAYVEDRCMAVVRAVNGIRKDAA